MSINSNFSRSSVQSDSYQANQFTSALYVNELITSNAESTVSRFWASHRSMSERLWNQSCQFHGSDLLAAGKALGLFTLTSLDPFLIHDLRFNSFSHFRISNDQIRLALAIPPAPGTTDVEHPFDAATRSTKPAFCFHLRPNRPHARTSHRIPHLRSLSPNHPHTSPKYRHRSSNTPFRSRSSPDRHHEHRHGGSESLPPPLHSSWWLLSAPILRGQGESGGAIRRRRRSEDDVDAGADVPGRRRHRLRSRNSLHAIPWRPLAGSVHLRHSLRFDCVYGPVSRAVHGRVDGDVGLMIQWLNIKRGEKRKAWGRLIGWLVDLMESRSFYLYLYKIQNFDDNGTSLWVAGRTGAGIIIIITIFIIYHLSLENKVSRRLGLQSQKCTP